MSRCLGNTFSQLSLSSWQMCKFVCINYILSISIYPLYDDVLVQHAHTIREKDHSPVSTYNNYSMRLSVLWNIQAQARGRVAMYIALNTRISHAIIMCFILGACRTCLGRASNLCICNIFGDSSSVD